MLSSAHPLHLHPVLPSSRKLVKAFEDEISHLVYNGTQSYAPAVKEGAQRIAGTLLADGVVSDREVKVLNDIKAKLNPTPKGDETAMAERQAANALYDALGVDTARKTVGVEDPKFDFLDLPDSALLPSTRKLLAGMKSAAGSLTGYSYEPQKYAAALQAEAKKLAGDDGLSGHQKEHVAAMATAGRNIGQHMTASKADFMYNYCMALVDLGAALGAPAK